ncbi:MAG: hypothetical protein U0229_12680 [Anaeromyxobacter sp.]
MRSASASRSRQRLLALAAAPLVLAGAACDRLVSKPGSDFAVALEGGGTSALTGKISLPLRFTVRGCKAFQAEVRVPGMARPLEPARQADGTWLAEVPISWLWIEQPATDLIACARTRYNPVKIDGEVAVTCDDRTARAPFHLDYAMAWGTSTSQDPISTEPQFLFPGPTPWDPLRVRLFPAFGDALLEPLGSVDWARGTWQTPVLAFDGLAAHLAVGCRPDWGCPALPVGPGTVPSERIAELGYAPTGRAPAWVPAGVVDLAILPDGDVLVVSQPVQPWSESVPVRVTQPHAVVSRLRPGPAPGVTVFADLPGEVVQTRLSRLPDGRFAFVTFVVPGQAGPVTGLLRTTDGLTVEAAAIPTTEPLDLGVRTGGEANALLSLSEASLSPDGRSVLVNMRERGAAKVGRLGEGSWDPLALEFPQPTIAEPSAGVAWGEDALLVWYGSTPAYPSFSNWFEIYDAAPPHARRYAEDLQPLPGSPGSTELLGAIALGDRFVVTTNTGVRILDRDGRIVGGLDPFPCRLQAAAPAVRTGTAQFTVADGSNVWVFDLAADP